MSPVAAAAAVPLLALLSAAASAAADNTSSPTVSGAFSAVTGRSLNSVRNVIIPDTVVIIQANHFNDDTLARYPGVFQPRTNRAIEPNVGCVHEGQWYREGSQVTPRDACLRCACARGALSCRRRACAVPPAPPPRCHLRYRRDACCPEIHCPDRIIVLEQEAFTRMDDEAEIAIPPSISHACVEGGTVWAAGSALSARAACEACFCLAGERRCVRPRCLPPPPGCRAPPAPGVCCPHRYYCNHQEETTTPGHHIHDCNVNGTWVTEGSRALNAEQDTCTRCFCLRGAVRCQPLQCAPALRGCTPLLRDNDCCPHQYHCHHNHEEGTHLPLVSQNGLVPDIIEDRSFHTARSSKPEVPARVTFDNVKPTKITPKAVIVTENLVTTSKVKRKTNETLPTVSTPTITETTTTTSTSTPTAKDIATETTESPRKLPTTDADPKSSEINSTEQPEGSVRIMINGTINCTAELSSTVDSVNNTINETEKILNESLPRVPSAAVKKESQIQTTTPVEIITNRYMNDGVDENESFTINVTSSLFQNNNRSNVVKPNPPKVPDFEDLPQMANKKTKGDYDFDYTDPTLPPSLPNLKIIPFVAADAVVDEDEPAKDEIASYPILEREDKYPVYYPSIDTKDTFATRREDVYSPTQYPVFSPDPASRHPTSRHPAAHEVDLTNNLHAEVSEDLVARLHEYTITASLGNRAPTLSKAVTKTPTTSTTFKIETPSVNLFSPPAETEGGFIPKGPGIIDEYFAVYPSTPQASSVPHLTTSMQLDIKEGECFSSDGRKVMEGDTISIACSECTCVWAELHCSPRPCHTPAGCTRKPALISSVDLCCGQLICTQENETTTSPTIMQTKITPVTLNETKVPQNTSNKMPDIVVSTPIYTSTEAAIILVNITKAAPQNVSTKTITSTPQPTTSQRTTTLIINNSTKKTESMAAKATTLPAWNPKTTQASVVSQNESVEYEDEEEDDGGFSFGSVLKLLLSDSYDTTTTSPKKKTVSTTKPTPPKWEIYRTTPTNTKRTPVKTTLVPFVPMSPHFSYAPVKKASPPTVNRIDHLVLGEATAIKKTTSRPYTYPVTTKSSPSTAAPTPSFRPLTTTSTTTQKPYVNTRPLEETNNNKNNKQEVVVQENARLPLANSLGNVGGELLKLAGCNIYGRMYRVGRIITELSTPCQECQCTELGVQCRQLPC